MKPTLGYYAYLRQKKEGRTTKTYEEWYKTYEPYKRDNKDKFIYLDEQLPPVEEWVMLIIVEVDHGESTKSKLRINYDWGRRFEDGYWLTENDWDEGQPWAIVAWLPMPKKPSEKVIRKHKINWNNVQENTDEQ